MNMTIEEAIKTINENREWIIKNLKVSDAIMVLLRVAEAWVNLSAYVNGPGATGGIGWNQIKYNEGHKAAFQQVAIKMRELVQPSPPPPKTKWDRLRDEVDIVKRGLVSYGDFLRFIDQLEKEEQDHAPWTDFNDTDKERRELK
ncbi:MAG: hypothetical protein WC891_08640 [Actinomycetota bacterium]